MITLTSKAIEMIKNIAISEGIEHNNIRVKIIGGGCAGFSYDMYYEEAPTDFDEIVEQDGIKVIIDPLSLQYLEDVEIDFATNTVGSGFKFNNPNIKSTCGCGSSFSA